MQNILSSDQPNPGTIRVVSKRKGGLMPNAGETVVDVDRSHAVLGNKYILHNHNDADERNRVIALYERDFLSDLARGGPMHDAIQALASRVRQGENIALRCWCAPRRCHADLLVRMIADQTQAKSPGQLF